MGSRPAGGGRATSNAGAATLGDEQREVARGRMVRAALVVLAERGLSATVEDIAAEAGVGVRTIFRHFGTRGRLLAAAVRARVREAPAHLRRPTPGEDLRGWLAELVPVVHRNDDLGRAYWEMASTPDLDDDLAAAFAERQRARRKLVRWATVTSWALAGGQGGPPSWLVDTFALHLSSFGAAALAADSGRPPDALIRASVPALAAAVGAAVSEA